MRAKRVFESLEFERGRDPKESMKIGSSRFVVPPQDINFSVGTKPSRDFIPVIGFSAKGYTKRGWQIFLEPGDWPATENIIPDLVDFLNTPEMKIKVAQGLQKAYEANPKWFNLKNKK